MPPRKIHQSDNVSNNLIECRVCSRLIRTHKAVSLFSSMKMEDGENTPKTIIDAIFDFADITICLDDDRSKHICSICLKALENGINLRQQIRENEQSIFTVCQNSEPSKIQQDEHEYELEYLEEFKDEIANGTGFTTKSPNLQIESVSSELFAQDEELLSKQLNIELSKEEIDSLQDGLPEQGKFAFEMPPSDMIAQQILFDKFVYLEICGERCCGCAHIASSRDALMIHAKEKHSQNYYADSSYTCPTCYQKFPTEDTLTKHTQYYSYSDVFLCSECQEAFNFRSHLMVHLEEVHYQQNEDIDDEYTPQTPRKKASRKVSEHLLALPNEKLIADTREFPQYRQYSVNGERCCACGLYIESIERHAAEEHLNVEDILESGDTSKCNICDRKFTSQRLLILHEQEQKKSSHLYECRRCSKLFAKKYLLLKHLQREMKSLKEKDNAEVNDAPLDVAISNPQESFAPSASGIESFYCCFRRCKEEYTTEAELLNHVLDMHVGRRRENEMKLSATPPDAATENVCPICLRFFESDEKLKQHRSYKLYLENQSCHLCGRTFMKMSGLREHQEREHLNLPLRFTCETCGKHFSNRSTLNQHRRVHGPFKSCPCLAEDCNSVFRDERLMRRHYRNVHEQIKPYGCRFCKKEFRTKESLDIHQRCHTGEKPFACRHEGCKRRFSHGTDRMRHERSAHTGERPHHCLVCNTGFLRKRELRIHNEKMHKEI